jgi:hypothetical protein
MKIKKHKKIILEGLKEYRSSYIENIHPVDEYDKKIVRKVKEIDQAIKDLETET